MELTAEHALEVFRQLLPLTKVDVYDTEMRYRMRSEDVAKFYCDYALRLILQHKLPLTVDVAIWERGGRVFEIQLVVAYAPEMEALPCY